MPRRWPSRALRAALLAGAAVACVGAGTVGSAGRALAADQAPRPGASERRFALLVGNDRGGGGTTPLLYAREDARRMHEVLQRLGGVAPDDAVLLLGRGRGGLLDAMSAIETRVRAANARGERTTLVFYYSGHAKDGVLQLGGESLAMDEIKRLIGGSASALRIAIVDSCRSGAVTRSKGARRAPAFDIESTSSEMARGTVFLASSSFDEDSQESDHLGGSYFSHHLMNALQGQADRSGDGRVTLAEAYAYTYARTVADTASSSGGAQHPTFSYDLKGNGDFVLSAYAQTREGLLLPAAAPAGTYFLVDARGVIAAEIDKGAGTARRIAVRAGHYTIKRRLPDRLRMGEITIERDEILTLEEARLHDAPFSDDPVKGAYRDISSRFNLSVGAGAQSFFDQPTRSGLFPNVGLLSAELAIADFLRRDWLLGFDLQAGGGQGVAVAQTLSARFRSNQVGVGASLFAEWPMLDGDLAPFAGVRLAFLLITRTFEEVALPEQYFSTISPGVVAGLRYRLSRRTQLLMRGRLNYLHYNVDGNKSLGFWELALALGYDF